MREKGIREIQRAERRRVINATLEKATLMLAEGKELLEFSQLLKQVWAIELDLEAHELLREWHTDSQKRALIV